MPHHKHIVASGNQFRQRRCDDARFNLGALLRPAGNAAEKFIARRAAHSRLVAATAERHIKRLARVPLALLKVGRVASDAD